MKIVDGIYQVEGVNCNVYLVEHGDKLLLIDTGLPRSDKKINRAIEEMGHKPTEVSKIIFTHHHIDHVGSAEKMKQLTGAKVAAHEADADYVAGKKTPPRPKSLLMKTLGSFVRSAPVNVDLILHDGDKVGRLIVVHTPGHSGGSISLLDAERKVMFVGDAVRFTDGKLQGSPAQYTLDEAKAKESIKKVAGFDFEVMLAGHGEALMPEASKKLKEFSAGLQ